MIFYCSVLLLYLVTRAAADYQCLCNYHVELKVYSQPDAGSAPSGYLYEFDCKPTYPQGPDIQNWEAVQFEKQIAFAHIDDHVKVQTCPGEPPKDDLVMVTTPKPTISSTTTTTTTTSTTTPAPTSTTTTSISTTRTTTATTTTTPTTTTTSTTTPRPTSTSTTSTTTSTTTTTANPSTTTRPTTTSTTRPTTSRPVPTTPVPHGDISKCPDHVIKDSVRIHGYVNQYDNYCFVLDPQADTWTNAEKHCTQRGGHLLTIRNALEQEFFTNYLKSHHWIQSVYIGLRDDKTEGTYYWSSGSPVTYTNWAPDFSNPQQTHASDDCVVMKADGKWDDIYCGIGLIGGIGGLEKHHFICQYGFDAKLPSIADFLGSLIGR